MENTLMNNSITTVTPNSALQAMKQQSKAKPFGAHFATKLEGVNSKLVCALSANANTCWDDSCGGQPLCSRVQ
jgi:hypothetical protein